MGIAYTIDNRICTVDLWLYLVRYINDTSSLDDYHAQVSMENCLMNIACVNMIVIGPLPIRLHAH